MTHRPLKDDVSWWRLAICRAAERLGLPVCLRATWHGDHYGTWRLHWRGREERAL